MHTNVYIWILKIEKDDFKEKDMISVPSIEVAVPGVITNKSEKLKNL